LRLVVIGVNSIVNVHYNMQPLLCMVVCVVMENTNGHFTTKQARHLLATFQK